MQLWRRGEKEREKKNEENESLLKINFFFVDKIHMHSDNLILYTHKIHNIQTDQSTDTCIQITEPTLYRKWILYSNLVLKKYKR